MDFNDQMHINKAYAYIHAAMNEIARTYYKDNILARVQSTIYTIEDTLHDYVSEPKGKKEA